MILIRSLALIALLSLPLHQWADPAAILAQADRDFANSQFVVAVDEYRRVLKEGSVPPARQDEVEYRAAQALGWSGQWERALLEGALFVKTHKGTIWEPRGLYWMGRLYYALPRSVAEAIKAGKPAPDGPENFFFSNRLGVYGQGFTEWNMVQARDALEAAHTLYPAFHSQAEQIPLDFDLAELLDQNTDYRAAERRKWPAAQSDYWRVDTSQSYQADWAFPKKMMYLYTEIRRLAASEPDGAHLSALSLLDEATWLQSYHREVSISRESPYFNPVARPFPYQAVSALDVAHTLIRAYPNDASRDPAQLDAGYWLEQANRCDAALAEYRDLVAAHPEGTGATEARERIQVLTAPSLALDDTYETPATATQIHLKCRNLTRVTFRAYQVDPGPAFRSGAARAAAMDGNGSFLNIFNASRRKYGAPDVTWTAATHDAGDHAVLDREITVPIKKPGVYRVEAQTGEKHAATCVIVSNTVILQQAYNRGCLLYAADRQTGRPQQVAATIQVWSRTGQPATITGHTRPDGTLDVQFPDRLQGTDVRVASLVCDGAHAALASPADSRPSNPSQLQYSAYAITDKAVYRPGEAIRFHEIVMQRHASDWICAPHKPLIVTVTDSRGKAVCSGSVMTDAFGSAGGTLIVPTTAQEGACNIQANPPGAQDFTEIGGDNQVHIEPLNSAYRRVTVIPGEERVALGQRAMVRIHVDAASSSSGATTQIRYCVYRDVYYGGADPRPYGFLDSLPDYGAQRGSPISEATVACDRNGNAAVSFVTAPDYDLWEQLRLASPGGKLTKFDRKQLEATDYRYTVTAEASSAGDSSPAGRCEVLATHHPLRVDVSYPGGYINAGETLPIDIRTSDMLSHPQSTHGTLQIFKGYNFIDDSPGKCILRQPFCTDAGGYGAVRWAAAAGGYYLLVYTTRDSEGHTVTGRGFINVRGRGMQKGETPDELGLTARSSYAAVGQPIKMLVNSGSRNTPCLLTLQTKDTLLDHRVIWPEHGSAETVLKVTRRDLPDVSMRLDVVRNGSTRMSFDRLRLPVPSRFASVTVQAEKRRYHPGETAVFHLHAADANGRPLRAEFSLMVQNSTVSSDQRAGRQDVRAYFFGDTWNSMLSSQDSVTHDPSYARTAPPDLAPWAGPSLPMPPGGGQFTRWANTIINRSPGISNGLTGVTTAELAAVIGVHPQGSSQAASAPPAIPGAGTAAEPHTNSGMAYWNPTIVTDSHGNATVRFTWPRQAAQWRAVAIGSTSAGAVGMGETRVEVR